MNFSLRFARADEGAALSRIAVLAKAQWGYTPAQLDAWQADLKVDPSCTPHRWTFVAEVEGEAVGVVQLSFEADQADVLHLWVAPHAMGQGIGTALMDAAVAHCRRLGLARLTIDADPNAEMFYAARGARRVGETPAPIDGMPNRVRPQMVIDF